MKRYDVPVTMSARVSKNRAQLSAKSEAKSSKTVTPRFRVDLPPEVTPSAWVRSRFGHGPFHRFKCRLHDEEKEDGAFARALPHMASEEKNKE